MLSFQTCGESHGKALIGVITGLPAGVPIDKEAIDNELRRRQQGYGRGGRMAIEKDQIEILSGVRHQMSLGSPIAFLIANKDHPNWESVMSSDKNVNPDERQVTSPRPGHADLPGAIKYNHRDMRNVLERASARETASRVAAGAIFKQFLAAFNIYIYSQVVAIGEVKCQGKPVDSRNWQQVLQDVEKSSVRCADPQASQAMMEAIDSARQEGESLGGCFEGAQLVYRLGWAVMCPGIQNWTQFSPGC